MTASKSARAVRRWLAADSGVSGGGDAVNRSATGGEAVRIDWLRCVPFVALHLICLSVFWVGWSWIALGFAVGLYLVRMFAITAFYHRYFSHRTFKTSRAAQFCFASLASTAAQRGPLWWASHHRHHHRASDGADDIHSPRQRGFWWSHVGWFLTPAGFRTDRRMVSDLARYPELRFLDRFDILAPFLLALGVFLFGALCESRWPGLGTDRWQLLVWGFFVSTVVLYHATYTINSVAHTFGKQRFPTDDDSRNNWLLALVTLGEGWHNNHHHYSRSARQGFYWWEIDITYWGLLALQRLGVIRDLRPVPPEVLDEGRALAKRGP